MRLLVLLLFLMPAQAVLINTNKLAVAWTVSTYVGVPGGIPTTRTNKINVTSAPYNADNTGVSDCASAIQSAIAASSAGDIIYFPAGTYRCNSTIIDNAYPNRTLAGDGPSLTTIKTYGAGSGLLFGSSGDFAEQTVSSGAVRGASNFVVAATTGLAVGNLATIFAQNLTNQASTNIITVKTFAVDPHVEHETVKVTGISGTTVSFWPPLNRDYSGRSPTIAGIVTVMSGCGLESLTWDMANSSGAFGIWFAQQFGGWIKNVTVKNCSNHHIYLYQCNQCEVTYSTIGPRNGGGSNGSGLLCEYSSANYIYDNIINQVSPFVEVNFGCSGNVFSYNFGLDSTVSGSNGPGFDSNHGPHNAFNIYEGNIAPNLQADGYFGGCDSDTIFNCWLTGHQPGNAGVFCLNLNRFTRSYSLVNNVIGTTVVADGVLSTCLMGYPNIGNLTFSGHAPNWAAWQAALDGTTNYQEFDDNVLPSTQQTHNWFVSTGAYDNTPADAIPDSLYLSSKPAWWGGITYPFGPQRAVTWSTNTLATVTLIPAQARYYGLATEARIGGSAQTAGRVSTAGRTTLQ